MPTVGATVRGGVGLAVSRVAVGVERCVEVAAPGGQQQDRRAREKPTADPGALAEALRRGVEAHGNLPLTDRVGLEEGTKVTWGAPSPKRNMPPPARTPAIPTERRVAPSA